MRHMTQHHDLQHEIFDIYIYIYVVYLVKTPTTTPKLTLNFPTLMSFFLLDFNTYTRDPHKNLIKKTLGSIITSLHLSML